MERKESRNGLELIKFAVIRLKGRFSPIFIGTFAMITPLILLCLVPIIFAMLFGQLWLVSIGFIMLMLFFGPLEMGYIKYFNGVMEGEQPKISVIYSELRFSFDTLKYMYMSCILIILYILGLIAWIIPACIVAACFSMVFFFQNHYKYSRLTVALKDCSKKMVRNRVTMFSYKFIFYIVYLLLILLALTCLILIFMLAVENLIVCWVVTVCFAIVYIFLYSLITVYYHSCNQVFFEETLEYNKRKEERLKNKTAKISEEKKAEIATAENKEGEEKTNKESSTAEKTTTKKSTIAKNKTTTGVKKTASKTINKTTKTLGSNTKKTNK